MEKCIVKTFDDKTYLCPNGENLRHSRPTVVEKSTFIEGLRDDKKVALLATGLPMSAEDSEFYKVWHESEKDVSLAVEAFCAEFGIDPKGVDIDIETKPAKPLTKAQQKAKEAKEAKEAEAAKLAEEAKAKEAEETEAKAKEAEAAKLAEEAKAKEGSGE